MIQDSVAVQGIRAACRSLGAADSRQQQKVQQQEGVGWRWMLAHSAGWVVAGLGA
jgi:hypothetical protein